MRRYFNTGDPATDHNLSRLDHFATQSRFDGDRREVNRWRECVEQSLEMLPHSLREEFLGIRRAIASTVMSRDEAERGSQWQELCEALGADLDKAGQRFSLDGRSTGAPVDRIGRPETRGEQVLALCERLLALGHDNPTAKAILDDVESKAALGVSADVRELRTLMAGKSRSDDPRYWFLRHVHHIRDIARDMHHLRG